MICFLLYSSNDDAIGIYIRTFPTLLDNIYRISYYQNFMHRKIESCEQKWWGNKEHKDANYEHDDEEIVIRKYEQNEKEEDSFLIIDRSLLLPSLYFYSKSTKANTCHKVLLMAKSSHFADVPSLVR